MNTKYVIVPQSELDKLEEARLTLYELNKESLTIENLTAISAISQPMWRLANTKWPIYEPGFVPEIES